MPLGNLNSETCKNCNIEDNKANNSCGKMSSREQPIIIDCDAGVDDALSIILALSVQKANLLGITCVHGNTSLNNVVRNVQRVLKMCNREEVPVFRGAETNLLGNSNKNAAAFHGDDGMGDVPDYDPPDPKKVQTEHAVQALIRLSKEHPGDIILNPIGPLTNIALAMRMDPDFTKRLKEIVIMGGNISGKGFVFAAEFNFYCDPEAAHIVLSQAECPVTVVPYETCQAASLSWDWFEKWTSHGTDVANFIQAFTNNTSARQRNVKKYKKFLSCDPTATAIAFRKDMILTSRKGKVQVETNGALTRGQMVEMSLIWEAEETTGPEVEVVLSCDVDIFQQLMDGVLDM